MRIPFSKDQIIERIRFENPWWSSQKVDGYYSNMKRREYFHLFYPLVIEKKIKRAVVLMGPRRVGKTVMLFHTIQELIDSNVPPPNICYFSVETPIYNGIGLEELLKIFIEINGAKSRSNLFIFFDEIQYLKNWEVHLKSLVDSYHQIKFVVSGSAAAALKLKSNESGAGRFTEFSLPPLTFHEYLSLKNIDELIEGKNHGTIDDKEWHYEYGTNNISRLNQHFIDYINFGGYPEVSLSQTIQEDPGRYIRNDIVDKVLLRDLPILYGIEDIQELNSLFTYIAYNTGMEMSLDSISKSSGVAKNTIKKYISYLEAAFLIKIVHRIDNNGKIFQRANFFKIYLTNPSLRCALFSPIKETDNFAGNLVETAIFSQWHHSDSTLHYARWEKGEIDIVSLSRESQKPSWVVEIKWTNRMAEDKKELKNIISFCTQHKIHNPSVTTYDLERTENIEGLIFDFIPSSLYCYTVGRNIITSKIQTPPTGLWNDPKITAE
ncbi:ATP-binding protein [Puia dinghuensis]|uniref:ATP-binding protein n=1 Tax=Puia dinghuensis TaxID=1792502 RepID=UPI00166EE61F|nr:ATP-binding protein [Puia dinghuensis]